MIHTDPARRSLSALIAPLIIAAGLLATTVACGGEADGSTGDAMGTELTVVDAALDLPPNPQLAAIRLAIVNGTSREHVLVGASSPDGVATIHRSDVDAEGRSTMAPVDRLEVPARSTVTFEPGGLHVMLSDIARDLEVGDSVALTLQFEDHVAVDVEVPVVEPLTDVGAGDHDDHSLAPTPPTVKTGAIR